jgi:hypothetical protein
MRKVLAIILLAIPPLLLMRWENHPGRHVPKWLMLAVCVPLVIALLVAEFSAEDEFSDTGRAIGNWLLLLMGLFGMGIGMVGFALRHQPTVLALFAWAFPLGALMTIVAMVRALRG